jgi:A-factor biosynthesis hotdog domain
MKRLLVVGDKFEGFTRDKTDVVTFTDFAQLVWSKKLPPSCDIWLGQGIEHDRLSGLLVLLDERPRIVNWDQILDQGRPSHQASVHKVRRENVLITGPRKLDESRFEAWLAMQDSGELLGDHMTGQHIQGMVLIEAARQMMLSVSEHFLLAQRPNGYYFVLNSMDIEYKQFVFPLPTRLSHEITLKQPGKGDSLKATCETAFLQNDAPVARVQIQYAAYAKEFIGEKEAKSAIDAYDRHVSASGTATSVI